MDEEALNNFSSGFCQVDIPLESVVNDYDNFALIYDEVMGKDYADIIFKPYIALIQDHISTGKIRYLGLACGTGAFDRGFSLLFGNRIRSYGIDVSSQQIEVARRKARKQNIEFHVGDVLEAEFPKNIDVATMNLDALNHLRSLGNWSRLFSKVYESLSSNGVFIFDINTQKRIIEDWNNAEIIIKPDMTYVQIGSGVSMEPDLVRRRLFMEAYLRGKPEVYTVIVEQVAPTEDTLFHMLNKAGFSYSIPVSFSQEKVDEHIFMKNRLHMIAYK